MPYYALKEYYAVSVKASVLYFWPKTAARLTPFPGLFTSGAAPACSPPLRSHINPERATADFVHKPLGHLFPAPNPRHLGPDPPTFPLPRLPRDETRTLRPFELYSPA